MSTFKEYATTKIAIGIFVAVLLGVGFTAVVAAYSNPCNKFFCSYSVSGYFTGHNPATAGKMDSVLPNGSGDAIPSDVNTVSEFIDFLQGKNGSSSTHNKSGSAFIVCLMLQQKTYDGCKSAGWAVKGRTITTAGWTELTKRLNNPGLSINFKKYINKDANFINSAYDSDSDVEDTYVYTRGKDESGDAIVMTYGSDTVFRMFRHCANPIDGLDGPPEYNTNYDLTPHLKLSSDIVEVGTAVATQDLYVNNVGDASSPAINWKIKRNINSGAYADVYSGTTHPAIPVGDTSLSPYSTDDTNYAAGTKLCFKLSVYPHANTDPTSWVDSAEDCVVVGKKPKTQVWGGDLLVGGYTDTSTSTRSGNTFGSWVEYAIFATGNINKTGSGAAFGGSGFPSLTGACDYSNLSFANTATGNSCTGTTGTIGHYTNMPPGSDLTKSFQGGVTLTDGSGVANNWSSGTYITGDITLNPSTLSPGKSIILKSSGTVRIIGDQKYNANNNGAKYTSIYQLPQLVIIANSIDIADSVTQVDAWLFTRSGGYINTCGIRSGVALANDAPLSVSMCNNKLTVNGPVMTDRLYLRRTAGSESANPGDAAEVFNLRADAYLWAYTRVSGSNRITTVHTTELPPRY